MEATTCPSVKADPEETSHELTKKQDVGDRSQASSVMKPSSGSSSNNCDGDGKNELKRKSDFSFLQPPAKTIKISELDVYLSEPLLENSSTLLYWKSASSFPRLQGIAKKLMAAPATSGGFDRLYPMAGCIVRAKRNRLPPLTTERLLLYKNFMKTKTVKKANGVAKN